jgi:hypothetical protein
MAIVAGRGVASGRADGDVTSGRNNNDVSQREDLANFISMITRDETPFMSSIGKTKATAIYHEWQTDELNAPGNSRVGEGTDYAIPQANPGSANSGEAFTGGGADVTGADFNIQGTHRTRLGNYTQINGKTIAISGTRRVIDQAGVADEYAYQLKKRGTELRRDLESDIIHTANVASATGARTMGGYQAWINDDTTVNYAGTVGAVGVAASATAAGRPALASQGIGTTAPANATTVANRGALSLSDIDEVMQKIYQAGGKANKVMLSPKLRRDFSDLMVTDSGVRRNIDMDGKLRQSVDVYMSDFGDLMVVPNYIMGLETAGSTSTATGNNSWKDAAAFIYDPMWFNLATLRPLQEVDVGQRGDSTIGMMVEECTMEVRNPIGCGAIYNLR